MDAMLVDAQIIRLYQAFFTRQPDQGGFTHWHEKLFTERASLADIAESFVHSDEFVQSYGGLDNDQFVNLVYQNVLGRAPDSGGLAHWLATLDAGLERGELMVRFSESPEHIQRSSWDTGISQFQLEKPANRDAIFQQSEAIQLIVGNGTEESSDIAALDVNGDGLLDILNARTTPIKQDAKLPLELFLNQGNGQFQPTDLGLYVDGPLPALQNTTELLKADLNGDGIDDLLLAGRGVDTETPSGEPNQLLLSDGMNHWRNAEANLPDDLSVSHNLAAGDIDGDGDLDLLVGNVFPSTPYLLVNDGNGMFTRDDSLLPEVLTTRDQVIVQLADLNNDGAADLIIGATSTSAPYFVLSDGSGSFKDQPVIELPIPDLDTSDVAQDIISADINGDGWMDLLVSHTRSSEIQAYDGNGIQVLINNKGQYFFDETDFRLPEQSSSLLKISKLFFEDLNGDGYKDILAEQTGDYFLNNGQGVFSTHGVIANYSEGNGPFLLADLDGDQQPELLVTGVLVADVYQ